MMFLSHIDVSMSLSLPPSLKINKINKQGLNCSLAPEAAGRGNRSESCFLSHILPSFSLTP